MIIDMHAHSSAISPCCLIPCDEVLRRAKEAGLDGIALTNHYQKSYVKGGDATAFAHFYTEEFRKAEAVGETLGMKVFFGAEVTLERYGGAHLLLYGISTDFLISNAEIYDWSLADIRRAVAAQGGAMIQAHPYRKTKHLLDARLLDGVEVNCHPLYGHSFFEEMLVIASENHLILTCGGDYHADTYRPRCGTHLPDDMTNAALGKYLVGAEAITLRIQEPNEEQVYEYSYQRPLD